VRQIERYRSLSDSEVLALKLNLALAQEITALEAGHKNWAELKSAAAGARKVPRVSAGPPVLKSAIPILLVRDVKKSANFFRQKLGFEIDFLHGLPPFYGAVSRDGICLHLRLVRQPFFAQAAAQEKSLILASIEVANVQGLFLEFKARGVEFAQPLAKHAWGGQTFRFAISTGTSSPLSLPTRAQCFDESAISFKKQRTRGGTLGGALRCVAAWDYERLSSRDDSKTCAKIAGRR